MALADEVQMLFQQAGLGSLAGIVIGLAQEGVDDNTFMLRLQDTDAYKQRFAANEARRRAGLRVLAPGEYLQLEQAYRRVLSSAGLPAGFYDSPSDFQKWLEDDVDPSEIQERAKLASKYVANSDPAVREQLRTYYGIGDSELVAYTLDRKRGLDLLEKQASAVQLGAAATHQGLSLSRDRAEHFADLGQGANAEQGFSNIAALLPDATRLSAIHGGDDVTQTDLEDEVLGGLASAQRKRKRLADQEVGTFSGGSGVSRGSLGQRTSGAY